MLTCVIGRVTSARPSLLMLATKEAGVAPAAPVVPPRPAVPVVPPRPAVLPPLP